MFSAIIFVILSLQRYKHKQNKLVFQKNKASVYFHIFQKKFVSLFENWGVMCYIDVKLVFLSANYEICK